MTGIPMMSYLNYYSHHDSMYVIAYQRQHSMMVMTVIPILSYLDCYSHHGQHVPHQTQGQAPISGSGMHLGMSAQFSRDHS